MSFWFYFFSFIGWLFLLAAIGCVVGCAFMVARRMPPKMIFDMAVRTNTATIVWTAAFMIAWAFAGNRFWATVDCCEFVFFLAVRVWLVSLDHRASWNNPDA